MKLTINTAHGNSTSQLLYQEIESWLKKQDKQLTDITEIELFTGPGSFTGLRVGAIVAQTLSLLLNIPINKLPPGSLPKITYGEDKWNLG